MGQGKIELSHLRCFVAVAEELNFRRAAERLNMSQPPLSRQIKLLEHALGLTLLERTNRSVRLTPAGRSMLESSVDLLQRTEYAVLSARQADRGEAGSIALGFVPSASLDFIPRIVETLGRDLPAVTLNPIEMMSYEIIEALNSGRLDLGLTRLPGGPIPNRRVVSESFVLAVPRDHALAVSPAPALADLHDARFIGYSEERGGRLRSMLSGLFEAAGIAPRVVQSVSQSHTVVALVNRGLGVALVPASSRAMQMENVVYRDISIAPQFRSDLYLATAPSAVTPLRMRVAGLIEQALAPFRA